MKSRNFVLVLVEQFGVDVERLWLNFERFSPVFERFGLNFERLSPVFERPNTMIEHLLQNCQKNKKAPSL